jgi:molybdopterin-guanine dinucleotide biosynthesis protein A
MTINKVNSHNNECLGVVLAGGLSSRMGTDKAQLMRDDTSMLTFSKQLLRDTGIKTCVVSGNKNIINDTSQVNDIVSQAGPVGGIYSVIKQYQPKALLVLPVDLPLMTSSALAKLKQIGELSGKACFYQDHNIPLYLPVNAFVELFLQNAFQGEIFKQSGRGPSIRALLKQIPHQAIACENNQTLFNTNTPEQWQQAQQTFKKQAFEKNTLGSL